MALMPFGLSVPSSWMRRIVHKDQVAAAPRACHASERRRANLRDGRKEGHSLQRTGPFLRAPLLAACAAGYRCTQPPRRQGRQSEVGPGGPGSRSTRWAAQGRRNAMVQCLEFCQAILPSLRPCAVCGDHSFACHASVAMAGERATRACAVLAQRA